MNDKYGVFKSISKHVEDLESTFGEFEPIKDNYRTRKRGIIIGIIIIAIFVAMIVSLIISENVKQIAMEDYEDYIETWELEYVDYSDGIKETFTFDEYLLVYENGNVEIRRCYEGDSIDDADYIYEYVIYSKENGKIMAKDDFYSFTLSRNGDYLVRSVYDDDYYYSRY